MAKARLVLNTLDNRVLPSATLANGVLMIDGTDGRDAIVVRQIGDQLRVRGELIDVNGVPVRMVPVGAVTRIAIAAGAGNDMVNLSGVHVAASVDAGAGDDRVFGGIDDDTVQGGAGDDRLFGFRGNDDIAGGAGDDRIHGGQGNDHLFGEDGDDRVNGQSGDDDCDGGVGDDRVAGGRGRDHNLGGGGDDRVSDLDDHHRGNRARRSVEGVITGIDLAASKVTIQSQTGDPVEVAVGPNTEVERNGVHTTLADFNVGDWAEAKFDSQGTAIKIESETRDNSDDSDRTDVEGIITAIDLNASKVTIQTQSGTLVNVIVGANTDIERNGVHTTLDTFQVGDRVEAKFDAQGMTLKIEAVSV